MKIYFFTKDNLGCATSRFRGFFVVEELKKRGHDAIFLGPPWQSSFKGFRGRAENFLKNFKTLFSISSRDVIYLVRTVYQFEFFFLVLFFKIFFRKKIIFDFDDPLFLRKNKVFRMNFLNKFANTVIVGSHFLKEWAEKHNKNVYLIPTSIPFQVYQKYSKDYSKTSNTITIGWLGLGPNHYENLKILTPVLKKLLKEKLSFKFFLIGAFSDQRIYKLFQEIEGLETEFIDKISGENPEALPRYIQKFDIGIMPLINNEWNKGKCSFKAIEYMACAIPTVASAIGENNFLIEDGKNGFLAKNEKEWVEKLKKLILDKNLREKIGKAGQKTIKERYSLEANAPKLIEIFQKI